MDELKRGFGDKTVISVNICRAAEYALQARIHRVTDSEGVKLSEVQECKRKTWDDWELVSDALEHLGGTDHLLVSKCQERLDKFLDALNRIERELQGDENASVTVDDSVVESVRLPDNAAAVTNLPTIIYDSSQQAWYKQYAVAGNAVYRSQETGSEITIRHAEISGSGANTDAGYFYWY